MLKFHIMIRLGFSPCPNDTFIFHAIANKKIALDGLPFSLTIKDVETLNRLAMKRALDVVKVSCHAFHYLKDDYHFLDAGAALGRGCGPLIVCRDHLDAKDLLRGKIAIPGKLTTAFLLLRLFLASYGMAPSSEHFVEMPFHEIMEAVESGRAHAGLIIHEGRFTYPEYGLVRIADLGSWWEGETGMPIPLGGIIARKSLGNAVIKNLEELIRSGIEYSTAHEDESMLYIRGHAQELSDTVIREHIALYVNDYTSNIGMDGRAALDELLKRAKDTPPLAL
jgi:1,4-dihydroxy-6-naphthoate synthase